MRKPRIISCDEYLAEKLFQDAINFQLAEIKQRVGYDIEEFAATSFAQIELRAAALERLMKCFSGLVQNKYPETHFLIIIYNELDVVSKAELIYLFDQFRFINGDKILIDIIEGCSNTYVDARYFSEKGKMPNTNGLDLLSDVFISMIYRRRPNWRVYEEVLWNLKRKIGLIPSDG